MRKLLFLLFPALAILAIFSCSSPDENLPCLSCSEPFPSQGGYYPPQNQYAYCLNYDSYNGYYNCSYMPAGSCSGSYYGSDNTCGGYWWQSSNPQPPPSSSSRPSSSSSRPSSSSSSRPASSSSVEYTGGSCNVSDYGSVQIGDQVWMAKNWGCYAPGSKCYDNDPANCIKYGRLYDWATAMNIDKRYNYEEWGGSDVNHQGICPSGWHLSRDREWDDLGTHVAGYYSLGARYLKSQSGWDGEDTYGFAALPGGYSYSDDRFNYVGDRGGWWSASENFSNFAGFRQMLSNYEYVDNRGGVGIDKDYLFSVRCVKD